MSGRLKSLLRSSCACVLLLSAMGWSLGPSPSQTPAPAAGKFAPAAAKSGVVKPAASDSLHRNTPDTSKAVSVLRDTSHAHRDSARALADSTHSLRDSAHAFR